MQIIVVIVVEHCGYIVQGIVGIRCKALWVQDAKHGWSVFDAKHCGSMSQSNVGDYDVRHCGSMIQSIFWYIMLSIVDV